MSSHYSNEAAKGGAVGAKLGGVGATGAAAARLQETAEVMLEKLEAFLRSARRPAVLEYGDDPFEMAQSEWSTETQSGRLLFHVLTTERSFSRRILQVERPQGGILECTVERFGGRKQKLSLLDLNLPQAAPRTLRGRRVSFGERFRRMLQRQFPGWDVVTLSAEMDLTRSLSPLFPRAVLERNGRRMAAMACPSAEEEPAMLTFALIWHHLVRQRLRSNEDATQHPVPLQLFLPANAGVLTAQRLRWLRGGPAVECRMFRYNEHGAAGEVDPADLGNLETEVLRRNPGNEAHQPDGALLAMLQERWHVDAVPKADGGVSLRIHGLEFARWEEGRFFMGSAFAPRAGLAPVRPMTIDEVVAQAGRLFEQRDASARNRRNPVYRRSPEAWLESAIRANLQSIDAHLLPGRVYGEVITRSGIAMGRADLVAVTDSGELVVLELKADEDIHLALQALDYWSRINWHAERGELDHLFPGIRLSKAMPRLLLVAPALSFHPSIATVLQYFSPEVRVERIGLNFDWQQGLKVAMRLSGSNTPVSHA